MTGHELIGKFSGLLAAGLVMTGALWLFSAHNRGAMANETSRAQPPRQTIVRQYYQPYAECYPRQEWYPECQFAHEFEFDPAPGCY